MLAVASFWLIESSDGIELLLQANDRSGSILIKLLFRSKLDIDVFAFLLDVLLFDATAAAVVVVADSKDDSSFLRDSFDDDDDDLSESSDSQLPFNGLLPFSLLWFVKKDTSWSTKNSKNKNLNFDWKFFK